MIVADLAGTSSRSLAQRLGVEDSTVRRWQEIDRLGLAGPALPGAGGPPEVTGELTLHLPTMRPMYWVTERQPAA